MKQYLLYTLLLVGLLGYSLANAQDIKADREAEVEEIISNIIEQFDEDIDDTYVQYLYDLIDSPYDINTSSYEELYSLVPILSTDQLDELVAYKEIYGDLMTIYELLGLRSFTEEDVRLLQPFIRVNNRVTPKPPLLDQFTKGKNELFFRLTRVLEEKKGYKEREINADSIAPPKYLGDPNKYYLRYRHTYKRYLSYGLTAEKDEGEEFFQGTQPNGFDFYSAHLFMQNVGPFKHLAIGDYQVHIGQGLITWTSRAQRKGPYVMDIKKQLPVLKQYTSVGEDRFFRGIGATLNLNRWDLTLYGSYNKIDATIISSSTAEAIIAEQDSIDFEDEPIEATSASGGDGLHRTLTDLNSKNVLDWQSGGAHLAYRSRKFDFGATVAYNHFSPEIVSGSAPYQRYYPDGSSFLNYGFNYKYVWENFHFFGETAVNDRGGFATLNSILINFDARLKMAILHRHYDKKYQTILPGAFGEATRPSNERGLYIGASMKPIKRFTVDAYFDVYKMPWITNRADGPLRGSDLFTQVTYKPKRGFEMYLRYKNERKEINAPDNETVSDFLVVGRKRSLRYHIQYRVSSQVTLRTRCEFSQLTMDQLDLDDRGFSLYQDIKYNPANLPLSFDARFALFDTDSYDTRIFAYENDVLYFPNNSAYFYQGSRYYLLTKWEASRNLTFWLRFSQTYYANRNTVSSGDEEIDGPTKSELKVQMRFKF